jgi:hypothetical protein
LPFWPTPTRCLCLLLIVLALTLGSCAPQPTLRQVPVPLRGEFMVLTLAETQRKYDCGMSQQKAIFRIGDVQLIPDRVQPGEEVNQIVHYIFCLPSDTVTLPGRIMRVVSFQGKELRRDVTNDFSFKPGVWAVGALVGVPKGAKSGMYTLDITVLYQDQSIKQSQVFHVEAPPRRR